MSPPPDVCATAGAVRTATRNTRKAVYPPYAIVVDVAHISALIAVLCCEHLSLPYPPCFPSTVPPRVPGVNDVEEDSKILGTG